jgi:hypothetical protein
VEGRCGRGILLSVFSSLCYWLCDSLFSCVRARDCGRQLRAPKVVVSDEGWSWLRTEDDFNTVQWRGELPVALGQYLWSEVGKVRIREILRTGPDSPVKYQRVRTEIKQQGRAFSSILSDSQRIELSASYSSTTFNDGAS